MTDFLPLQNVRQRLDARAASHLRRVRRTVDGPCAPRIQLEGREVLAFCSNDYLGLASDSRVVEALRDGASLYGTGSGASHLVSGHGRAHQELENKLAEIMAAYVPDAQALYFSTGYMANLAIISSMAAMAKPGSIEFFSEALNHASLIDGLRLSRSKVHVYPHADLEALEKLLASSRADVRVVVSDSVFSMDGCLAPVAELAQLARQYGAWLLLDDAHGFGMLGEGGRGILEHCDLSDSHIVYMGTLGKAAGVSGAFACAHRDFIDWLVQSARPYIYTTAAPPALAHALLTSLAILAGPEGRQRRAHLQELIAQLAVGLSGQSWQLLPSPTAIQPVVVGDNARTLQVAAQLEQRGVWVPAIRPPTVPEGTARLRLTLSAAHKAEDVQVLLQALAEIDQARISAE